MHRFTAKKDNVAKSPDLLESAFLAGNADVLALSPLLFSSSYLLQDSATENAIIWQGATVNLQHPAHIIMQSVAHSSLQQSAGPGPKILEMMFTRLQKFAQRC